MVKNKKLLSFVVPVLNENENIEPCVQELLRLKKQLLKNNFRCEFIFTDNQSTDGTHKKLQLLCSKYNECKTIRFTTNIGYQNSILAGIINSSGDAVIQLDCDLQDPVDVIPKMIEKWLQGYNIVYGIRTKRDEFFLLTQIRKVFYRLILYLSEVYVPPDAGDFRLIDKKVVSRLKKINNKQPYLRGIIASFGFRQIGISYSRKKRKMGRSKFPLRSLLNLGIDGLLSQSIIPLRVSSLIGFFCALVFCFLFAAYLGASLFLGNKWPPGFTTLVLLIILQSALMFTFLGILGEYTGRIFKHFIISRQIICENHQGFGKKRIYLPGEKT